MRLLALALMLLMFIGCDNSIIQSPDDAERLDLIAAIYEKGDMDRAVIELESYLKTYPNDSLAWVILGNAHSTKERVDEAQLAYETALKINPQQFQALTGLGIIHRMRGDYDAAMKAYEQALEIDGTYAQAYSSMTTIALKRLEDAKALEYALKGYNLDKTDPIIAANLAVAYHYNNDIANRDKFAQIAEQLGYANMEKLQQIFSGEMTVRD